MRNHARVSKRAAVPGATTNQIGSVRIVNQAGDTEIVSVTDADTAEQLRLVCRELRAQSEMLATAFNLRDPVKAYRDAEDRALN